MPNRDIQATNLASTRSLLTNLATIVTTSPTTIQSTILANSWQNNHAKTQTSSQANFTALIFVTWKCSIAKKYNV